MSNRTNQIVTNMLQTVGTRHRVGVLLQGIASMLDQLSAEYKIAGLDIAPITKLHDEIRDDMDNLAVSVAAPAIVTPEPVVVSTETTLPAVAEIPVAVETPKKPVVVAAPKKKTAAAPKKTSTGGTKKAAK